MRYAVVIEKAEGNYSAYVPDLPGCVAAGPTVKAVEDELREAIRLCVPDVFSTLTNNTLFKAHVFVVSAR